MEFSITLSSTAEQQLYALRDDPALQKRYKAVLKTLKLLSMNPRHPGLHTHEYSLLTQRMGKKVFEAYAENNTPGAYRVFWTYGENRVIEIVAVTAHP